MTPVCFVFVFISNAEIFILFRDGEPTELTTIMTASESHNQCFNTKVNVRAANQQAQLVKSFNNDNSVSNLVRLI